MIELELISRKSLTKKAAPMNDLNRLRELLDKATPGPWNGYDDSGSTGRQEIVASGVTVARCYVGNPNGRNDAQLIVALRNCAPEMLAVVDAARRIDQWSGDLYEFDYDIIRDALAALDAKMGGEG